MKKLLFIFALTSALFSCRKETTNTNKTDSNTTTSSAVVSSIDCASNQLTGVLKKGEVVNSVSFKINYFGGNGKTYVSQIISSTGVTGLTAKLEAGILTNTNGTVTYFISGTPTTAGIANFAIALGEKSCSIRVNVEDNTQNPTSGYGPNISDVEANLYKTVKIGTQVWMAENLKTSKYSDGTTIPNIIDNSQWQNNTTGAWSYYNNDGVNNAKYGKLYNWYAVSKSTNGNKNICPSGWHVPTDAEWRDIIDYLGGPRVAGSVMKDFGTNNWVNSNDATNESLYTGLPGGYRYLDGSFNTIGKYGNWWSSTESNLVGAWYFYLYNANSNANMNADHKNYGFSVRCLMD